MKRIFVLVLALVALLGCLVLTSCNYDIIDTQFSYDTAIISLPNGEGLTLQVAKWRDYEDGEQLQITDTEGNVWLVSSYNCVLVDNK